MRDCFVLGCLVSLALSALAQQPAMPTQFGERPQSGPAAARGGDDRSLRPPSLNETLMRVLLLGSENTSEAARRHADLVIKPRAQGIGLLEFDRLDAAREAGRAAARQALERAPASLAA